MWKAAAGSARIDLKDQQADDDWETDPDFVNDVTEQQQRWGSTTIEGSGRTAGSVNMEQLRKETEEADAQKKKQELIDGPNPAFGYGGKFGVQKDRMDSSAVGHDYIAKVEKHVSQKDYSSGFGGKFGVQTDRVDKSAHSWEYKEKVEKHASQKDYSSGFGGKFGVQTDRQDKSALGWDHVEKVDKHESQKDYNKGFGGKFGIQTDRQDKSAVGWDHHENPQKHESQLDHKKGFGGKFGVQTDRMDKSASAFGDEQGKVGTTYTKVKPDIGSVKPSDLKAKFENMSVEQSLTKSNNSSVTRQNVLQKTNLFMNAQSESKQHSQSEESARVIGKLKDNQNILNVMAQEEKTVKYEVKQEESTRLRTIGSLNESKDVTYVQKEEENSSSIREVKSEIIKQENIETNYTEQAYVQEGGQEDEIVDTGFSAVALYDYQAAADDEISFDPDDVITHVEMIDEGWWRGLCKGKHGLFPANYVHLQE